MRVSLYFDPICPWCWDTAQWLIDVRPQRGLEIGWHPFSLAIKNEDLGESERSKMLQHEGRRALRVVEAVRAKVGPDAVEGLYLETARQWHGEGVRRLDFDSILEALGLEVTLAAAADDSAWDTLIDGAMAEVMAIVGSDVGVPILVFEGAERRGFYGPIMSPRPIGEEAAALFDHLVGLAHIPGFFELKRSRD